MDAPAHRRDPAAIYAESFRIARAETDLSGLAPDLHGIALRLVHAAADPEIARALTASPGAVAAGAEALAAGAAVFVDCQMVRAGITRRLLPRSNEVVCTLDQPAAALAAAATGTTRSAAAVDLWDKRLAGAVVAIGNAPTALFRLIERLDGGGHRPALIVAMPVGFVGAAEAKQALIDDSRSVPFIAVAGRRGGSALAAAAVNALALGAP
jgi:precorrin-8X/cobalt-precorrin-8 methylmutase